jgi:hypothetical protein
MQFDAHIYVLHTIYVHPHIALCSEGTRIASMDVKQPGIEIYHSSPHPPAVYAFKPFHTCNLSRQPLTAVVTGNN